MNLLSLLYGAFGISIYDWWMLFRATRKQDLRNQQSNQPRLGSSTYLIVFAQLATLIIVVGVVTLVFNKPMLAYDLTGKFWLAVLFETIIYVILKLVVAVVQTLINFVIIRVVSARYERVSRKEK